MHLFTSSDAKHQRKISQLLSGNGPLHIKFVDTFFSFHTIENLTPKLPLKGDRS